MGGEGRERQQGIHDLQMIQNDSWSGHSLGRSLNPNLLAQSVGSFHKGAVE